MKAKEILQQMVHLKSAYGMAAKMYLNEQETGTAYLLEIFDQMNENRASLENHLGSEVCNTIQIFCEAEIKKRG